MRVRFFATCLGDRLFAAAAADAVRLLRSLGVEVEIPRDATCCGQPAWNAGHVGPARRMAEHTARLFPPDLPVVLPSGSCAAMLRHSFPRMALDEDAPDAWELASFLVRVLGVTELGSGLRGMRVAYHHGCHALRSGPDGQGGSDGSDGGDGSGGSGGSGRAREEPLTLLRGAGAEVVPWDADEECCGFGGLFAVKLPWISGAMADRKLDSLAEAAEGPAGPVAALTSADGGCLLQLGGRLGHRRESGDGIGPHPPRVVPLATLLWQATGRATAGERP